MKEALDEFYKSMENQRQISALINMLFSMAIVLIIITFFYISFILIRQRTKKSRKREQDCSLKTAKKLLNLVNALSSFPFSLSAPGSSLQ